MIKKLSIMLCVSAVSLSVLAGCGSEEKTTKQVEPRQVSATEPQGTTHMTRQKMASGLEYEIVTPGTGVEAVKGKSATVHYTGWLNNGDYTTGTKFDSSVDRGRPFTFGLGAGQVIRGWDEGVAGMKVGETRRLFIPSALGYGARGAGAVIKPNSDLIFDVQLLEVK